MNLNQLINIEDIVNSNDNLNKHNFWDILYKECPKTMNVFCSFIDNYKMEVQWNLIFSDHLSLKFHDIPFEMQLGIILRFFNDTTNVQVKCTNIVDKKLIIFMLCDLFEQCETFYLSFMSKDRTESKPIIERRLIG